MTSGRAASGHTGISVCPFSLFLFASTAAAYTVRKILAAPLVKGKAESEGAVTRAVLAKQNAETSNAIIAHYEDSAEFCAFAKKEGDLILVRDDEDATKLQQGIDFAKAKGVIDPAFVPERYIEVDVLGKCPDEVADLILARVGEKDKFVRKGGVIVLCGKSGTGKGTTVAKLRQKLDPSNVGRVVTWSNGNIFRSVTLLAATWCEQQKDWGEFDAEKALTKENLERFIGMLKFGKFKGKYDTRICGLGLDLLVSEIQNTELKVPKVAKNIPTVAEKTQGEVILFAADAIRSMGEAGLVVLLEGREQTVNYVRTPHRFTLTLSDDTLIGKRRAAQRLMAAALSEVPCDASPAEVEAKLNGLLKQMAMEQE